MPIVDLDDYTPAQARERWGYQLAQYTPPADSVIIDIDVDFVTRPITPPIHLVQFDKVLPVLAIHMYSNRSAYAMPQQSTAAIRVNNGNGAYYYAFAEGRSADFTTVYFQIQADLCLDPGFKPGVIEISNSDGLVNSSPIQIEVEQNPMPEDVIISSDDYINLRQLIDEVEKWAYGDCQHLTNNSWIVKGCKDGVQIGTGATAEGAENTSTGAYSHTEGYNNTASGAYAHAEGNNSTASALASHAEGSSSATSGNAHAEGGGTTASGSCSHSEGNATTASGGYSHAEGNATTASGSKAHAEGDTTVASEPGTHAEGDHSEASNNAAHAEGSHTTASGESSHSEGNYTTASGDYSHSEGDHTTASGNYSHAEGGGNTASGNYSHAGGSNSTASGAKSFVHGNHVTAANENEVVFGEYNAEKNAIFEVGYGTDASHKFSPFYIGTNGLTTMVCRDAVGVPSDYEINSQQLSQLLWNITFVAPPFTVQPSMGGYTGPNTIELAPIADIPKDSYGTFTAYIDLTFAAFESFITGMTLRVINDVPAYYPDFRVTRVWNVESGNERDISVLTQNYSISNVTSAGFRLTVTFNVHNNSASNVPANDVRMRVDLIHHFRLMLKAS